MKDWRGTTIKVGSTVIYPSRQGSAMWMSEGVVEAIDGKRLRVRRTRASVLKDSELNPSSLRPAYPDPRRVTVV